MVIFVLPRDEIANEMDKFGYHEAKDERKWGRNSDIEW